MLKPLNQLTAADFSPYLNQAFQLSAVNRAAVSAELTEVAEWGPVPAEGVGRRPFSLLFRGPFSPLLPQQIYAVTHEQMGTVEIFLVPIGPDSLGMQYQAIFV